MDFYDEKEVLPYMPGMWREALQNICGIHSRYFNGKHQDCPNCGGKDRFRWTDKLENRGDGGAYCSGCGADKGIGWLMKLSGEPYSECINILGRYLGKVPQEYVVKRNKQVTRDNGYDYGKMTDHDRVVAILNRTEAVDSTPLTLYEGIENEFVKSYQVGVKTHENGRQELFHTLPMQLVHEDGPDDEYCNILFIDEEGREKMLAGDLTFGSVIVTNQSEGGDGPIYLARSWVEAMHFNIASSFKCDVWACIIPSNVEIVAYRYKGKGGGEGKRELRVVCSRNDRDMLAAAEDRDMKVIVPNNDNFKGGFERKLYVASSLL